MVRFRVFASRVDEAAPKLAPAGNRRLDAPEPPKVALIWLVRFDRYPALDCGWKLASSGGGEPDDGVDGDGEPGSGGEFMVSVNFEKLAQLRTQE